MPNPGLPVTIFGKSHTGSPKNPDLNRKSPVDTKLSEFYSHKIK